MTFVLFFCSKRFPFSLLAAILLNSDEKDDDDDDDEHHDKVLIQLERILNE